MLPKCVAGGCRPITADQVWDNSKYGVVSISEWALRLTSGPQGIKYPACRAQNTFIVFYIHVYRAKLSAALDDIGFRINPATVCLPQVSNLQIGGTGRFAACSDVSEYSRHSRHVDHG